MTLFLAGIILLFFWLSRSRQSLSQSPGFVVALLAYAIPAIFFLYWTLGAPENATRLRVALVGIGFMGEDLTLKVGGDRENHHIWEDDLPGKAANNSITVGKLELHPGSSISLQGPNAEPKPVGILGFRGPDKSFVLPNAIELKHGDKIHFDGQIWQVGFEHYLFRPPKIYFYNQGQSNQLPLHFSKIPIVDWELPIWRDFPVTLKTYPLDKILQVGQADTSDQVSDSLSGFFYRNNNQLFIAALRGDIFLERAGQYLTNKAMWEIPAGTRLHILGLPRWRGIKETAGGVRDLRSFRVYPGERSLKLIYDTPEIYSLAQKELLKLRMDTEESEVFRVNLAMGDWDITDKYIHFSQISLLVGREAFAILELPKTWLEGFQESQEPWVLTAPGGQQKITNGEPAWLGEHNLAAIQIDLLKPPVLLAFLTLVLVLAKTLLAVSLRLSALQLIVAGAIEFFVLFRVLLGYRVWIMPPFEEEAMKLALMAWAFLPWAFLYASQPSFNPWRWLPAFFGLLFSAIWCYQIIGGGLKSLVWVGIHVGVLGFPFLVRWIFRDQRSTRRPKNRRNASAWQIPRFNFNFRQPWVSRILTWVGIWWSSINPWTKWAFGLFILRIFFLFLGWRESLSLGGTRMSLSIIHIPLALLIEAGYLVWLWRKLEQRDFSPLGDLWSPFIFIGLFLWFFPGVVTSDFGLFLLNYPLFVIISALLVLSKLIEDPQRSKGYKRFLGVCFFILLIIFVPKLPLMVLNVLEIESDSDRNYLRFLQQAYFEKLQQMGTRNSEDLVQMIHILDIYTSGPLGGRGYTESELSLKSTALREHTLGIFVAGEWGTLGVIGLMFIYMVIAFVGYSLLPWRPWYQNALGRTSQSTDILTAVVGLTGLTFAFASIYIILATYNLVLFTGKNLYLFGLDSGADIIESLVLLLIIAVGVAIIKDKETASW